MATTTTTTTTTTTKTWADTPFTLIETPSLTRPLDKNHYCVRIASEMAHVHNALIRGLNSIYNQAPHIPSPSSDPQTVKDFLFYCTTWCDVTEHHHAGEEKIFFPGVEKLAEKPGLMQGKPFHTGLHDLHAYVSSPETATNYSGAELCRIIDSFAAAFTAHLNDEIPTLLELEYIDAGKLKKLMEELETYALACDKYTAFPFIFTAIDGGYEGGVHRGKFPPVPFFVPYLIRFWYARRYEASWRFGPCDFAGGKRELVYGA